MLSFRKTNNEVRFWCASKGAHFLMEKGCCFIGSAEESNFAFERKDFLAYLSAFLFHLTFIAGVKRYYFPYREELFCPANRLLDPILYGDAEVKRILLSFSGEYRDIPYLFSEENRFEDREEIAKESSSRESLYRVAIDKSEYCVFYLDPRISSSDEIAAWEYASALGKRVIDLYRASDPRAFFAL